MELRYILTAFIFCSLNSAYAIEAAAQKKTNKIKFTKAKVAASKAKKSADIKTTTTAATSLTQTNQATAQVTTQVEAKNEAKLVSFGFGLSSGYNTQAEKQADGSRAEYISHEIMPSMKLSDYSLAGVFIYNDDIKNPSSNEWQDSSISLSRKAWRLGEYFNLGPSLALGLPLSKATRDQIRLKYVLAGALGLSLNTKTLGAEKLILSYGLGYAKMNNEFETKENGDPLTSYRIRQSFTAGYQITDSFSFMTQLRFDSSYSYANVVRNGFLTFQAFEYKFNENFSMNIVHANGGQAFLVKEANSDFYLENNMKLYDPKSSEYSLGISLSI